MEAFKIREIGLYTDFYELSMAQAYFYAGKKDQTVTFNYFFRTNPFNGGFSVFAGIQDLLDLLENFSFSPSDISFLKKQGLKSEFLNYLKNFRFQGSIWSVKEGEIVFPNEPLVQVKGNIIECQLIESLLLNIINYESLISTKAFRIKYVAGQRIFADFGLRRAQGFGALHASRAAAIGGASSTSNVLAGKLFNIPVSGTMAHSWIQSFENELDAFRTFTNIHPDNAVLLVDTFNTLESGVPNAIIVAKEMEAKGQQLKAIRLDSGDLSYLSKKARKLLDAAGLKYVKIAVSNQLDEHLIRSLNEQGAPIDLYGVGTKLITAYDNPALDGVYKLGSVDGRPALKVSENVEKITLPGVKNIFRFLDDEGMFYCDGISLLEEENYEAIQHPYFPSKQTDVTLLPGYSLLTKVMAKGELLIDLPAVADSAAYAKSQLNKLNPEHKRFDNPHTYKVGITHALASLRDHLLKGK
ncbi:MAG: nicotinate phosphoribosyltransferase [Balneolales bacterium]|nr:nicotinate phosphoribosyltransferase [Balneolales bacterium]